jgi:hypothetical protein
MLSVGLPLISGHLTKLLTSFWQLLILGDGPPCGI